MHQRIFRKIYLGALLSFFSPPLLAVDMMVLSAIGNLFFNHDQSKIAGQVYSHHETVLDLSNKNLTTIPPEIQYFQHLQTLILKNNRILEIPEWFVDYILEAPDLTAIDLSCNLISAIPDKLQQLQFLEKRVRWPFHDAITPADYPSDWQSQSSSTFYRLWREFFPWHMQAPCFLGLQNNPIHALPGWMTSCQWIYDYNRMNEKNHSAPDFWKQHPIHYFFETLNPPDHFLAIKRQYPEYCMCYPATCPINERLASYNRNSGWALRISVTQKE